MHKGTAVCNDCGGSSGGGTRIPITFAIPPGEIKNKLYVYFEDAFGSLGLKAGQDFSAGEIVVEYTGAEVSKRQVVLAHRKKKGAYISCGIQGESNSILSVDSLKMGNESRFINHCCDSNLCNVEMINDPEPPHLVYCCHEKHQN